MWRGAAATLLGIAYWTSGDLEAAHRSFADGVAHQQMTGHIRFQIVGTYILADIRIAQGRLHEAVRTYERSLRLATEHGEPVWGTADLYVGLSELHRERGDLEAATEHLMRSKELGEHFGLPETRYRWYVAMARIKEAQGDLDGALDLLDEAERQYVESPDPDVRPVAALKTRVWVAQGQVDRSPGLGAGARACPPTTTSATCASSSTSPWRGCSSPDTRAIGKNATFTRRWGSWSAS